MLMLHAYRESARRGRPVVAQVLSNGVVIVISPAGTQNNLADRQDAARFLRAWRRNRSTHP